MKISVPNYTIELSREELGILVALLGSISSDHAKEALSDMEGKEAFSAFSSAYRELKDAYV